MKIKIESAEEFFTRGKDIARLADQQRLQVANKIVSFEDADDLARVVSSAKIELYRAIRIRSGSITDLSKRLNRDRSSIKRDIDVLKSIGLVELNTVNNAGHGIKKEVVACEQQILMAW